MSNFQCPHCGMTNIDCGRNGYKTPKEIDLEDKLNKIKSRILLENGDDVLLDLMEIIESGK